MTKKKPLSNKELHITIKIAGNKEIQKLNKKHFNRDYPTDVLSFNMDAKLSDGTYYLGDIIVNKDQAKKQASEYGNDTEHEIAELVAHGMLHLLGVHHPHDDEEEVHGIPVK